MTKQLKELNQCLLQRRRNGYSIAEILLVFGIIAGVLIGVWAMYTMLGDKSDAQTAIAEIQMIKKAAHEYKYAPGKQNKYTGADHGCTGTVSGAKRTSKRPEYIWNGRLLLRLLLDDARDLDIAYKGVRDLDICRQILNQFGQVNARSRR